MIRIIFDDGELIDCDHISKVYVEQYEMDKVIIVGKMEDENARDSDNRTEESNTDTQSETPVS